MKSSYIYSLNSRSIAFLQGDRCDRHDCYKWGAPRPASIQKAVPVHHAAGSPAAVHYSAGGDDHGSRPEARHRDRLSEKSYSCKYLYIYFLLHKHTQTSKKTMKD